MTFSDIHIKCLFITFIFIVFILLCLVITCVIIIIFNLLKICNSRICQFKKSDYTQMYAETQACLSVHTGKPSVHKETHLYTSSPFTGR